MSISIFKVLLIGGLLFSTTLQSVHGKIIAQDKMIFKVGTTVFSLNDLKKTYQFIEDLKCMYPDSFLYQIFKEEYSKKNLKYYQFNSTLSDDAKNYFKSLINFSNLMVYARSQNVVVDGNIVKFLYLTAQKSGCSLNGFLDAKTPEEDFKEVIRLEIFVRSRFLPTDKGGKTTQADLDKAILSATNLLRSIGRQVENEFYW